MKANMFLKITVVTTILLLPITVFASRPHDDAQKERILQQARRMQVPFIANTGQIDNTDVSFYAHTFAGTLFVENSGTITYSLPRNHTNVVIKETFPEKQGNIVTGTDPSPITVNRFKGNDRSQWASNIPTYGSVSLGPVHDGIDLTLKAYGNNVEKLFTVSPGARPEAISVTLTGAEGLKVNAKGELEVGTACGPVRFTKPVAYQDFGGEQKYVEVAYVVNEETYGFDVGKYDITRPLIIDPLMASTFTGGTDTDTANSIALDGSHVYVTGRTGSSSFPTTSGSYDEGYNGDKGVLRSLPLPGSLLEWLSTRWLAWTTRQDGGISWAGSPTTHTALPILNVCVGEAGSPARDAVVNPPGTEATVCGVVRTAATRRL